VSNQSLVLQSVTRARAGLYTCVGSNQEGDGESNPVYLDVKCKSTCFRKRQKIQFSFFFFVEIVASLMFPAPKREIFCVRFSVPDWNVVVTSRSSPVSRSNYSVLYVVVQIYLCHFTISSLKRTLVFIMLKNSVRSSKRTSYFTTTKIDWLMLFREIIAVYSETRKKPQM
jgi:hypothetical protein